MDKNRTFPSNRTLPVSLSYARRVHKAKMHKQHEHWVNYSTFRQRVQELNRTLEEAINTPANVKYRDKDRTKKVKKHIILYRIKKFFRKLFRKWPKFSEKKLSD